MRTSPSDYEPQAARNPGEARQCCLLELSQPDPNYGAAQVYATLSLEEAVRDVVAELAHLARELASASRHR
jgi:hypothetical protein